MSYGMEQRQVKMYTIADLQCLAEIYSRRGYRGDAISRLLRRSWSRLLRQHLPGG